MLEVVAEVANVPREGWSVSHWSTVCTTPGAKNDDCGWTMTRLSSRCFHVHTLEAKMICDIMSRYDKSNFFVFPHGHLALHNKVCCENMCLCRPLMFSPLWVVVQCEFITVILFAIAIADVDSELYHVVKSAYFRWQAHTWGKQSQGKAMQHGVHTTVNGSRIHNNDSY